MNSVLSSHNLFSFNGVHASDDTGAVMGEVTQLGWLLLNQNLISTAQLQTMLLNQAVCGKRLGDLLLEAKLISTEQLGRALSEQAIRRRGHWVI